MSWEYFYLRHTSRDEVKDSSTPWERDAGLRSVSSIGRNSSSKSQENEDLSIRNRMKTHQTPSRRRGLVAAIGAFTWCAAGLQAAPFLYSSGDLILTFRQNGNASDYVVNLGKATNYNALAAGSSINITNLSAEQLSSAFASFNGLKWSVAAANRPPGDPAYPIQTLWVSAPRVDADTQSAPWLRKGQFLQGNAGSQIDGVGYNAALSSNLLPGGPANTAVAVVIPVNAPFAIGPVIGVDGNYVGNFQGKVEAVTVDDFEEDALNVSRADLYELQPGTSAASTLDTPGKYLGYFELKTDGVLNFNAGASLPPRPSITSIARNGDVTTVSFTTVNGVTYRLRATDAAGLTSAVSSWSTGASVVGNGSVQPLLDTSTDSVRFYTVEIQP